MKLLVVSAILLLALLSSSVEARAIFAELPPIFSQANFFFKGVSSTAAFSDTVALKGSFQFLNTSNGNSFTAKERMELAMTTESVLTLSNTFVTVTPVGYTEDLIDESGCYTDTILTNDPSFPNCNAWGNSNDGAGGSIWSRQCVSKEQLGVSTEQASYFVTDGAITRIVINSTYAGSGDAAWTSTVLDVDQWLQDVPLPSVFDHDTAGCSSSVAEKRGLVPCPVCKTMTEVELNLVFNTFACKYKDVPKAICDKTPFGAVCKAAIDTVCQICTNIGQGSCSWGKLAYTICQKTGSC